MTSSPVRMAGMDFSWTFVKRVMLNFCFKHEIYEKKEIQRNSWKLGAYDMRMYRHLVQGWCWTKDFFSCCFDNFSKGNIYRIDIILNKPTRQFRVLSGYLRITTIALVISFLFLDTGQVWHVRSVSSSLLIRDSRTFSLPQYHVYVSIKYKYKITNQTTSSSHTTVFFVGNGSLVMFNNKLSSSISARQQQKNSQFPSFDV